MITRTFISYDCTATLVDKVTKEITSETITVPMGAFNKEKPEKSVAKRIPANKILLSVDSVDKVEDLRGITEEDFLAHSVAVTRPASQQKKTDDTVNA